MTRRCLEALPIALFGSVEEGYRVAWRRQERDDFGPAIRTPATMRLPATVAMTTVSVTAPPMEAADCPAKGPHPILTTRWRVQEPDQDGPGSAATLPRTLTDHPAIRSQTHDEEVS